MAKKKTTDVVDEAVPVIVPEPTPNLEVVEPVDETIDVVDEATVEQSPVEGPMIEDTAVAEEELSTDFTTVPIQAVDYLKRHPEVDAVYIDKFGGLFPKNTPKVFVKDAVLYQNPYFKQ